MLISAECEIADPFAAACTLTIVLFSGWKLDFCLTIVYVSR